MEIEARRKRRAQSQSVRKACMGSTDAARRAGSKEAAKDSTSTKTAPSVSTSGSRGLTPNRNERIRCDAAEAPSNPSAQPTTASLSAEVKTSAKISDRCEPKAIRMAISWERRAAEKAMTL